VRIEWSSAAVADLEAIADWIEQDRGVETATRIAHRIYQAVQSLRTMPDLVLDVVSSTMAPRHVCADKLTIDDCCQQKNQHIMHPCI
jgi:plasmid stabilization system protein ParE